MYTSRIVLDTDCRVTGLRLLSNNSYSGIYTLRKEFKCECEAIRYKKDRVLAVHE